jgi:hypothetical protein
VWSEEAEVEADNHAQEDQANIGMQNQRRVERGPGMDDSTPNAGGTGGGAGAGRDGSGRRRTDANSPPVHLSDFLNTEDRLRFRESYRAANGFYPPGTHTPPQPSADPPRQALSSMRRYLTGPSSDPNYDPPSNADSMSEEEIRRLLYRRYGLHYSELGEAPPLERTPITPAGVRLHGPGGAGAVSGNIRLAHGPRNAGTDGSSTDLLGDRRVQRRELAPPSPIESDREIPRERAMDDDFENRRDIERRLADVRRTGTGEDPRRRRAEGRAAVLRLRNGTTHMEQEVTHRMGLYDWAARNASDDDEDMDDDGNDTDPEADGDGWRDLEEALSTHIQRRNARTQAFDHTEADMARATSDMYRRVNERAARRRDERIASLIEGNRGLNPRLRHRASRERNLRAMDEFMAEREQRPGGMSREEVRALEIEAGRRELERRHGVHLHRSERVVEMLRDRQRERQSQWLANTRMRNMLEHLSRLRDCDPMNPKEAAALAKSLEVDLDDSQCLDVITDLNSIPPPVYSSLLTPGATFTGSQHAPHDSCVHLLSRDRDYLRRMVANRNLSSAHLPLPGSMATLADAERLLLDRPYSSSTQSQSRQQQQHSSTSTSTSTSSTSSTTRTIRPPDHWPVSVTLHSVDLTNLTVTGTMSANHIPDKIPPGSADHKPEGSSMMSFFEGEIIDFRKFTLETETYKREGVEVDLQTDARYWGQLGPWREVVEGVGVKKGEGKGEEEDKRLARCLGSREWLGRVMTEWIFMRYVMFCSVLFLFSPVITLPCRPLISSHPPFR